MVSGLGRVCGLGLMRRLLPFPNFGLCSKEVHVLGVEEVPLKLTVSIFKCKY